MFILRLILTLGLDIFEDWCKIGECKVNSCIIDVRCCLMVLGTVVVDAFAAKYCMPTKVWDPEDMFVDLESFHEHFEFESEWDAGGNLRCNPWMHLVFCLDVTKLHLVRALKG